jgi:hypothetical protein
MASLKSNGESGSGKESPANAPSGAVRTRSSRVRRVNGGDTARSVEAKRIEGFVVSEAISSAQEAKVVAAQDIVRHADSGDMPALA